jgi:hypothetical protein
MRSEVKNIRAPEIRVLNFKTTEAKVSKHQGLRGQSSKNFVTKQATDPKQLRTIDRSFEISRQLRAPEVPNIKAPEASVRKLQDNRG